MKREFTFRTTIQIDVDSEDKNFMKVMKAFKDLVFALEGPKKAEIILEDLEVDIKLGGGPSRIFHITH